MADLYAVMGHPISHSRSPDIHRQFALQTDQNIRYDAIHVELDGFAKAVESFYRAGGAGLNVTLPFKEQAWQLADRSSVRADRARAANTLSFSNGRVSCDNTDGVGLLRDLANRCAVSPRGQRVLLLGAGGAARGALSALLEEAVDEIVVANRTHAKALQLVDQFGDKRLAAHVLGKSYPQCFDLIINSTAASLGGDRLDLSPTIVGPQTVAYDMMYGAQPSAFLQWAEKHGARAFDGLGMLVEQAAESFYIWRRVRPQTAPVLSWLRAKILDQKP